MNHEAQVPSQATRSQVGRVTQDRVTQDDQQALVDQGQGVLESLLVPGRLLDQPDESPKRLLRFCSVVVPAFNEVANLPALRDVLVEQLERLGCRFEVILVDDGSTDGTGALTQSIADADARFRYVQFARNFGHEAASTAGLQRARGDVAILMDADLQDPPELIHDMIEQWHAGYDVVTARRRKRHGESLFKRVSAWCFYRLLNHLSERPLPPDTGDFRLMDRKVVDAFARMPESNRFVRGIIGWLGFRHTFVDFDRPERNAGETKYNIAKLLSLSLDALTSFSRKPLRMALWLGLPLTAISAFAFLCMLGAYVGGIATFTALIWLTVLFLFISGLQMTLLGILGEYVGRTYVESQHRPLYVVRQESTSQ